MPQVQTLTQFSVFLVNKPGVLAQVTAALAQAKINLLAVTLVDSQEHGVLRMVSADANEARGNSVTVREVLDRAVQRIDTTPFSRPARRLRPKRAM